MGAAVLSCTMSESASGRRDIAGVVGWVGLLVGPGLGLLAYVLLPTARVDESGALIGGLSGAGRATAAVAVMMAVWWMTEALPLSATALLPIALFPVLGVSPIRQAVAPYADPVIFLFMGGFILGLGMERWGLHKRIALLTISVVGTRPVRLIGGFMVASAVMSMWVSNTATAAMMLPIGVSVIGLVFARLGRDFERGAPPEPGRDGSNFATCLMLGIAYGASIGGIGTLIGTPPNTVLKGFVEREYGQVITFAEWLRIGVPFVAVFLPIAWIVLTRFAFPVRLREIPGGKALIAGELRDLGAMKRGEWAVFIVFCCTALAWVFHRPAADLLGFYSTADGVRRVYFLTDEGIAIIAALALFVIPVRPRERIFAMDWQTASRLPWGILLLFGGGLSLASAMDTTGVTRFIGEQFQALRGLPLVVTVAAIAGVVIFLTELTSNTAVTTTLMPVLAGAAVGLGVDPAYLLVPAALAASCAFMLPVATPPNAIVFGSGYVSLPQMARAGLMLNLIGIVLVSVAVLVLERFVVTVQP